MYKVQVLLSTYNGEKYIDEQIESLLSQEGVDLHILIRDDGSTDQTVNKLYHYIDLYPDKITLLKEPNLGVVASYFELLKVCSDAFDFYAFCDQDDVWDCDKIIQAVRLMQSRLNENALMYCSPTRMVTETLSYLGTWPHQPLKPLSLHNSLIENVAVGCTTVLNQRAMKLIKSNLPSALSNVIMHDWWAYVVVSAFGQVIFDSNSYIQYRQHSHNVLGGQVDSWFVKWKKRLRRFIKGQNHQILSRQAKEFFNCYYSMLSDEQRIQIQRFLDVLDRSILHRMLYVLRTPFYRQVFTDNLIYKLVYIAGRV